MAQVVPHFAALQARQINVVAVSFGSAKWAQTWLKTTKAPFPVWLDPGRRSYQTYDLGRSFWNSWGPVQLLYYARALLRGQKLQPIQGDSQQLGGDLIVDRQGRIQYLYRSRASIDRPELATLLAVLEQLPG